MRVVTPEDVKNKKVLLRLDLDVPISNGRVLDDFRLKAGINTLDLCLEYAQSVIVMGHLGRPGGKEDPNLSVKPIVDWFEHQLKDITFPEGKFHILENLRFEAGEETCDPVFTKELADLGDIYINEAFASHNKASSTTELAKVLPSFAGIRFAQEVETLTKIRQDPKQPLVFVMGGAKIEDKLPVVLAMAKIADHVLVGGKLVKEIEEKAIKVPENVLVAKLNRTGEDIHMHTLDDWEPILKNAATIVWNGPVGKFEDEQNFMTKLLAKCILHCSGFTVIGGGDTISALTNYHLLNPFLLLDKNRCFISTGGGAMLKFLEKGTLPTIEALNESN